jgi:hypothetical protein
LPDIWTTNQKKTGAVENWHFPKNKLYTNKMQKKKSEKKLRLQTEIYEAGTEANKQDCITIAC